jgi:hypothetical protein
MIDKVDLQQLLSVLHEMGPAYAHPPPRLVVLASCSSQWVGEAFLEAGVGSAVCVSSGEKVSDDSAACFNASFYAALSAGWHVRAAFQCGVHRLTAAVHSRARADAQKFILLGEAESNEAPLWTQLPRLADSVGFADFSRRLSLTGGATSQQHDDNGASFFSLQRALPAMPIHFTGCNAHIGAALAALDQVRFVQIAGPAGAGKSVVAAALAQHVALRQRMTDGVHFIRLGQCPPHKAGVLHALCCALLHQEVVLTDVLGGGGGAVGGQADVWIASADSVALADFRKSRRKHFRGLRPAHPGKWAAPARLFLTSASALGLLCGELGGRRLLLVLDDASVHAQDDVAKVCHTLLGSCPQMQIALTVRGASAQLSAVPGAVAVPGLAQRDAATLLGKTLGRHVVQTQQLSLEDASRLAASCQGNPRSLLALAADIAQTGAATPAPGPGPG